MTPLRMTLPSSPALWKSSFKLWLSIRCLRHTLLFVKKWARLLVIDGLDAMSRPQHPALHCPTALIHKKIPLFIILISSRSNLRFVIPSTRMTYVISYPHSCLMNNTFLTQILKDIFGVDSITSSKHTQGLRTYIPATWPSSQIISSLVQKSSGRFIYASTFIKYADSIQHRPVERWDAVLRISNSIVHYLPSSTACTDTYFVLFTILKLSYVYSAPFCLDKGFIWKCPRAKAKLYTNQFKIP